MCVVLVNVVAPASKIYYEKIEVTIFLRIA